MNFCLSDLVPPLRWSDAARIRELRDLGDSAGLPDAWWRALPIERVLAATDARRLGTLLAELTLDHWPAAAAGDILPALYVLDPDDADEPHVAIALDRAGSWPGLLALTGHDLRDQPFIQALPVLTTLFGAVFGRLTTTAPRTTAPTPTTPPPHTIDAAAPTPAPAAIPPTPTPEPGPTGTATPETPAQPEPGDKTGASETAPGSGTGAPKPAPDARTGTPATASGTMTGTPEPATTTGSEIDEPKAAAGIDAPAPDRPSIFSPKEAAGSRPAGHSTAAPADDDQEPANRPEKADPSPAASLTAAPAADRDAPLPGSTMAPGTDPARPHAQSPEERAQSPEERRTPSPAEAAQPATTGSPAESPETESPERRLDPAEDAAPGPADAREPAGAVPGGPIEADRERSARATPDRTAATGSKRPVDAAPAGSLGNGPESLAAATPGEPVGAEPENAAEATPTRGSKGSARSAATGAAGGFGDEKGERAGAEPGPGDLFTPPPGRVVPPAPYPFEARSATGAAAEGGGTAKGGAGAGSLPDLIDAAFADLDDETWAVAQNRVFTDDPSEIEQLAKLFAVPRERMMGHEEKLRARLAAWLASPEAAPYREHMDEMTRVLGVAAPKARLVAAADWHRRELRSLDVPAWQFVLATLPGYHVAGDWLVAGDLAELHERTRDLIVNAERPPTVSRALELVSTLGIHPEVAKEWLENVPQLRIETPGAGGRASAPPEPGGSEPSGAVPLEAFGAAAASPVGRPPVADEPPGGSQAVAGSPAGPPAGSPGSAQADIGPSEPLSAAGASGAARVSGEPSAAGPGTDRPFGSPSGEQAGPQSAGEGFRAQAEGFGAPPDGVGAQGASGPFEPSGPTSGPQGVFGASGPQGVPGAFGPSGPASGPVNARAEGRGADEDRPGHRPSGLKDVALTRRCFQQPDGRWWLRIDVTEEHLAGAECALPSGFAAYLGLSPGESRTVVSASGELTLHWQARPVVESMGRLLHDVGAAPGSHLFITLADETTLRARHLPGVPDSAGDEITRVLRLVGYTAPGGTMDQAIRVIGTRVGMKAPVTADDLVHRLRERGDRDLLALLT